MLIVGALHDQQVVALLHVHARLGEWRAQLGVPVEAAVDLREAIASIGNDVVGAKEAPFASLGVGNFWRLSDWVSLDGRLTKDLCGRELSLKQSVGAPSLPAPMKSFICSKLRGKIMARRAATIHHCRKLQRFTDQLIFIDRTAMSIVQVGECSIC